MAIKNFLKGFIGGLAIGAIALGAMFHNPDVNKNGNKTIENIVQEVVASKVITQEAKVNEKDEYSFIDVYNDRIKIYLKEFNKTLKCSCYFHLKTICLPYNSPWVIRS